MKAWVQKIRPINNISREPLRVIVLLVKVKLTHLRIVSQNQKLMVIVHDAKVKYIKIPVISNCKVIVTTAIIF